MSKFSQQLAAAVLACLPVITPAWGQLRVPVDMAEAKEAVDEMGVVGIEGLWEYPGDGIIVMISHDMQDNYRYNMTVVESQDVRLRPGVTIGQLTETPLSNEFKLKLYTDVKNEVLTKAVDCAAKYVESEEAIIVERPSIKVKITPSLILPVFWSRLRMSVRVEKDMPAERLKEGLKRVYPETQNMGVRYF